MTEQDALLVLNAQPGLGAGRIRKLVAKFGNALTAVNADWGTLAQTQLLSDEMIGNLINFSKDKFLEAEYNQRQRKQVFVLTMLDEGFPCSLEAIDYAPVVLYVRGDIGILAKPSIAIVGSRASTRYGQGVARDFARVFAQAGLSVVSGLARGIDTAAHQGCLEANGKTIAVIGGGFNCLYPRENEGLLECLIDQQGAAVSEFAMDAPPVRTNFPWRNRIISGLSMVTVVIEAGLKSGALITTDYALAQGKDVFVVPSGIDHDTALGSNRLIKDGARVALSAHDVLDEIQAGHRVERPDTQGSAKSSGQQLLLLLSKDEELAMNVIHQDPVHIDDISQQSGLAISQLMAVILNLELKHAIRQLPGHYYARNEHG